VAFSPKIATEKDLLEMMEIMMEAGNLIDYIEKLFLPQLGLLKSEQSELKFISILKKNSLKQNMGAIYPAVKTLQSRTTNPLMSLQYEYLLKYIRRDHPLGKTVGISGFADKFHTDK
jgi:hypothetical protein